MISVKKLTTNGQAADLQNSQSPTKEKDIQEVDSDLCSSSSIEDGITGLSDHPALDR